MVSLARLVTTNLVHYNLWTNVTEVSLPCGTVVLRGSPPPPSLVATDPTTSLGEREYVLPVLLRSTLTLTFLEQVFAGLEEVAGTRPEKVIGGVCSDDGTVMYYFIWDGVAKPRQN